MLIEKLEAIARGELRSSLTGQVVRKLLVCMPPGSAKSTYSSKLFPPWLLCLHPQHALLACANTAELAALFGRSCRNLIDVHHKDLGYDLSKHSKAADEWETNVGGVYFARGVGGAITGRRADCGLIDDPIKGQEDADSKLTRDRIWNWYINDFKTRLKPNAFQILIQTRWNEDDLAGRLLTSEREEWEVVEFPMEATENDMLGRKEGEMLWTEWFTPEMLREAKKDARSFSCLWQQNPTPAEGNFFKAEWIRTYASISQLPKNLRHYVGSDHAVSEREAADYTCLLPAGLDSDDNLWILPSAVWKKMPADEAVEAMIALIKAVKPVTWWAERGHITKSIGPFLRKRMREEKTYAHIEEVVSTRDKQSRAQGIKGRISQGKVFFPSFAAWWPQALHEMLTFPAGKHDDFVDALSEIGQGIDAMCTPTPPPEEPPVTPPAKFAPTVRWLKQSSAQSERQKQLANLN